MNEIITKCDQEERMRKKGTLVVNHIFHKSRKKLKGKNKEDDSVKRENEKERQKDGWRCEMLLL